MPDIPLFALGDLPPQPPQPSEYARMRHAPIAAPADWKRAAERAEGQCEHRRKSDRKRCFHSLSGYYLRVAPDGTFVCDDHWNEHRKAAS
jgi:hypothetical protein